MTNKWIPVVLGAWIVVSPFILNITGTGRWSNVIVGLAIVALGYSATKTVSA
ncbi:MAG: SPW repeat protein [Armatimonadota bacterium]|nr:SPW repeat protein [Armatimonadota bacterium]